MNREPFGHRVIRASAGSGKTHQLTNRYLGLLAAGIDPDLILATTFTRKAAGEILNRVLERLAEAVTEPGQAKQLALDTGLSKDSPEHFVPLLRKMLRALHRLRIGTLDSFYLALARSFSLELGLPAGWSICEEPDDAALHRDALERLLELQPEDLSKLYSLLNKGETKRSVQEELQAVLAAHYESLHGTERSSWGCLQVPVAVPAAERTSALEELRTLDFSGCDERLGKARLDDIDRFERQDWIAFVGTGLAAKVQAGESQYYKKEIPPEAQAIYRTLLRHARSEVLRKLAEQTEATWDLLDRFHRELWTLKQATGALRFGEVTQTLADALERRVLLTESLAFRLDGAVEHLLLDEFQDTSLAQWRVMQPIARGITHSRTEPPQSFFCVGDVKQAIYGWRGGMPEIFDTLPAMLGELQPSRLDVSQRSAQPIIDVVNEVFGNLDRFQGPDKCQEGLAAWERRFERHSTVKKDLSGYVSLHTGPRQRDGEPIGEQRGRHCEYVAKNIRELVQRASGLSIAVLCRTNDVVARMIYELRECRVEASEEGGNPLTDSPAVELILSLFTLADHPGHSIAWFHLRNSPLQTHFAPCSDAVTLARRLRRELMTDGYGRFTYTWAKLLAPACNRRDLSRLQQLVELAYGYHARSTLRTDDFVAWVRQQHIPDPSSANVRVMTIHGAKGLQFDIVVLPELDVCLLGPPPKFVVRRDSISLDVNFVCRYAKEDVQQLLAPEDLVAFEQDRRRRVEESLSLLYVAMTRAIHALHLYIPGPRSGRSDTWYKLLLQTLAPNAQPAENTRLFEHGDAEWFEQAAIPATPAIIQASPRPERITFRNAGSRVWRGLEHVAPSRREGRARVRLDRVFDPAEGTATAAGTLYHAWFATIGWLDDGVPTDDALRTTAEKLRADLPGEIWRDLDRLLAEFHAWLGNAAVRGVLCRSAYTGPRQQGFPTAFVPIWTSAIRPLQVERERRFLVPDGTQFLEGSLDRVVWLGDLYSTVAADVIDFKTDAIKPGDKAALDARTEHYRPQLEAYRRAVARLAQLPAGRVAARLVFTCVGQVVEV
jgi:ATP-dependent exoDNAse (exonuclease V) beta subunit